MADNIKKKRGSILIIALWSLCLLSIFAVVLGSGVRQKISLAHRIDERSKLRLIAEAGVKRAITELRKASEDTPDSLSDNWRNSKSIFKKVRVGEGTFSVSYEYFNDDTKVTELRYGIVDEESKININTASSAVLRRLFRIIFEFDATGAQELAASIIDWRDSDSELSIPLGSAEDRDYRNSQFPYEAKDAEFEVVEELLLVNGMTVDLFERLKNYITIYGSGNININTASSGILSVLGLRKYIVDRIILFRQGDDGITGTNDDNIFDAVSSIVPVLSGIFEFSESEIAELNAISDQNLTTNSSNFTIESTARLENKKGKHQVRCVVDERGKILYWREL